MSCVGSEWDVDTDKVAAFKKFFFRNIFSTKSLLRLLEKLILINTDDVE